MGVGLDGGQLKQEGGKIPDQVRRECRPGNEAPDDPGWAGAPPAHQLMPLWINIINLSGRGVRPAADPPNEEG